MITDIKTRRKTSAQSVEGVLCSETQNTRRLAERVKGRKGGEWGSVWYSKLTHSHGTQAPIRVTATLIKPDIQPLAAG